MGKLSEKLYKKLLSKKPEVFNYYNEFKKVNVNFCKKNKIKTKLYLIKLFLTKKAFEDVKNPRDTVKPTQRKLDDGFINLNKLMIERKIDNKKPTELLNLLENYDVISFDVFDTCIFRPFKKPTDLFYIFSNELNLKGFINARIEAETISRLTTKKPNYEIDIYDIYTQLSKMMPIKIDDAEIEFELEKKFCYANEFILKVFKELKCNGKKLIAISDMYLPKQVIEEILNKNGFIGFDKIFVSNEAKQCKSNGKLFKWAKREYKEFKSFIHIGDNYTADVLGAKKGGFKSFYYMKKEKNK